MASPFFSIIIPVYNTEQYLPRALNSIFNQDFDTDKIEVIIINDGSPNTVLCDSIIDDFSKKLHIIYKKKVENEGPFLARKTGVFLAKGAYSLFLDPDDEYVSKTCKTLYKVIGNTRTKIDFIQFNTYLTEKNNKAIKYKYPICNHKTLDSFLASGDAIPVWDKCYNTLFIKAVCQKMPDFFAVMCEDYYQAVILGYHAQHTLHINDYLHKYHIQIGVSATKTYSDYETFLKMTQSVENVFFYLFDFFHKENVTKYDEYLKQKQRSFYVNALQKTTNQEVILQTLNKLDTKEILQYILYKMQQETEYVNNQLEIYDSLRPLARLLNKPVKLLRIVKRKLKRK